MKEITNNKDLKNYLTNIQTELAEKNIPPVLALSALKDLLNHPEISDLLDDSNKKIAVEIWQSIEASGLQVDVPPMLSGS